MTVEELKTKLDAGETPCVLDVREARELVVARYPFPVLHIPMAQIPRAPGRDPEGRHGRLRVPQREPQRAHRGVPEVSRP